MPTVNQELLTSANYVLIGQSGITNVGLTVVSGGNIGAGPGSTAITGFPPGTFVPPAAIDNVNEGQARIDASAALTFYQGLASTQTLTSNADIGSSGVQQGGGSGVNGTFRAGVYTAATGILINTPLTLDAQGNSNALFVFQAGTTVTQAIAGQILLVNGAQANNVIWVLGTAWTSTGPGAVTVGNILSSSGVALGGGVLNGRAFAILSGSVTIAAAETITAPAAPGPAPITPGQATVQCLLSRNLGSSVTTAWPQVTFDGGVSKFLDLIQIVDAGGITILNVDFKGTVNYPAVNPTTGNAGAPAARIGVYYTRLDGTATLAAVVADTWKNWDREDIIQVVAVGGQIVYLINWLGVASGS
jgi:Ice-binding-like